MPPRRPPRHAEGGTDATGKTVWTWRPDAFGIAAPNQDPDGDGAQATVNLRLPGQYYDKETELHYNWHRYYDPVTGRYLTSDPVGLRGGLNTYTYAFNNALYYMDRFGLASVTNNSSKSIIVGGGTGSGSGHSGNYEQVALKPGDTIGADNPITTESGDKLSDVDSIDTNGDGVAAKPYGFRDISGLTGNGEKVLGTDRCPRIIIEEYTNPCGEIRNRYRYDFSPCFSRKLFSDN